MKSQFRQNLKFHVGNYFRLLVAKLTLGGCGKNVFIDKNVHLMRFKKNINLNNNVVLKEASRICSCNQNAVIKIGSNSTIGYNTFIFCSEKIVIGDNCLIAPFVYIVDSDHQIKKSSLINEQENDIAPVMIGDDVWIGSNSLVLKGVSIGEGAVVAANSVVNKDVPPYEVWGGSPAKKIDERK